MNIPRSRRVESLVALAVEAERAGWDGVFFWDHVVWRSQLRLDVFDPWTLLAVVAVRTEQM